MNPFDRLDRIAGRSVDWLNGQEILIVPLAEPAPNQRNRRPDPEREPKTVRGVFEYVSAETGLQLGVRKTYREANDFNTLRVGREPVASIDLGQFNPDDPKTWPRQGDRLQVPGEPGAPRFEIVSAQPDGHSRIVLKLTSIGAA